MDESKIKHHEPTSSSEIDAEWRNEFRELAPVELWGATVSIGGTIDKFKEALITTTKQNGKNHFGYFIHTASKMPQYHLSKYPRRKYGPIPDNDAMRKQLSDLLRISGQEGHEEQTIVQPKFRIVLGLEEGYGAGRLRTLEDVAARLGDTFNLSRAEIFTVRSINDSESVYHEPAVRIQGDIAHIQTVYALAESFGQERFVVDDFELQTSHIVETKLCPSSDQEQPPTDPP